MTTQNQLEYDIMLRAKDKIQENSKQTVKDPLIFQMIDIVRRFIRDTKSICYGGTAINNILPTSAQFYTAADVPDYDFYHYNAMDMAKRLADILHQHGFIALAKAGVHQNTFKVYANFMPLADITQCDRPLYNELRKRAILKKGLLYADPNFLRMSIYLELSRPEGDITRWEKIMSRLQLLNQHYPMQAPCASESDPSLDESLADVCAHAWDICVQEKVVFLGGILSHLEKSNKGAFIHMMDGFHETPHAVIAQINRDLNGKVTHVPPFGEIVPAYVELSIRGTPIVRLYETVACHNYNEVTFQGQTIRLATMDTLMNMTLALSYSSPSVAHRHRYLCMAQFIFEKTQQHRLTTKGMYRRFSLTCLGKQDTLVDILRTKYDIYNEMQKNATLRKQYDLYFLNYNPAVPRPVRPSPTQKRKKPVAPTKPTTTRKFRTKTKKVSSNQTSPLQSYLNRLRKSK